ncbi:MAG: amidohydrolase family protein [Pseudomonadota bacterium]
MDSAAPPFPPETPQRALPVGAWDAHVHLLGGPQHPLSPNRVENPPEGIDFDTWLAMYRAHLAALGCARSLIVHSIIYGTDNTVTREAVRAMGPEFRGVGLLPDGSGPAAVRSLAADNIVAVRLNYVHGGVLSWDGAKAMAPLLADHGLHIQMLLHADKHIKGLAEDIRALPVPLVIDHCGWPLNLNPDTAAIDTLCALMSEGHVYVKLSAPYRLTRDITEAAPLMPRLLAANPERCLWGSDWPHIMLGDAHMPHAATLADQITGFTDVDTQKQIFVDNPNRLFMP